MHHFCTLSPYALPSPRYLLSPADHATTDDIATTDAADVERVEVEVHESVGEGEAKKEDSLSVAVLAPLKLLGQTQLKQDQTPKTPTAQGKLTRAEQRATGGISTKVYRAYIDAAGGLRFIFIIFG